MLQSIYKIILPIQTKIFEFFGIVIAFCLVFFYGKKNGKQELKEQNTQQTINALKQYEQTKNNINNTNNDKLDKLLEKYYRD